jgi:hypothetical protein
VPLLTERSPAKKARAPKASQLFCVQLGALGLASILTFADVVAAPAPPAVTHEYDLKAAFLFNFAQFVEWPRDCFADPAAPLVIGVLGEDPFGASLDEIVDGETVDDHPLVVRRFHSVDEIGSCHILFISLSESARLEQVLKTLGHRSVLTVGEAKDFTARSGMIGFELAQRRVRLRINLTAANDARLTISSKLLRQAQIVRTSGGRN